MTTILIENGTLLSPGAPRLVGIPWAGSRSRASSVAALGPGAAPESGAAVPSGVIDARHMAVLPGLVNAHTHLSQTFLRGLADDRPLLRWLKEVIWPAQAAMTPEDQHLAALLGLVENLRCGATTVVQHHKLPGYEYEDAVCRAAAQVGLRMVLARGWVDLGSSGEPLDAILADMAWLHDAWDGANRGRITVASGPLAPWRCCDDAMREVTALARSWGAPPTSTWPRRRTKSTCSSQRCGRRHIEWLADLGCLGPDTQLVHAVHVTDAELDLIAESGATGRPLSDQQHVPGLRRGAGPQDAGPGHPRVRWAPTAPARTTRRTCWSARRSRALLAKHSTGDAQALVPADVVPMLT